MTHPQSFHEHLQFILKLFVLLRLEGWRKKLIKRRNPTHILLPFTLGQVGSKPASLGEIRWTRNDRGMGSPAGQAAWLLDQSCLNATLKQGMTMSHLGPPHEAVMRACEGGGRNSAELWMRSREAGRREPGGTPSAPSRGRRGRWESGPRPTEPP